MDQEFWNDAYNTNPHHVMVADHILDDELAEMSPGTALDLGCGSGFNALKLARRGWTVSGVDWSEEAIKLAREAAAREGLSATFIIADTTLWQPGQTFDLVISTYALPGGAATGKTLKTAVNALAPGGTLIVAEWDRSMAGVWGFDELELPSTDEIVKHLPELVIDKAEVLNFENVFTDPDDPRNLNSTSRSVALVRAHKNP